jgi:tagaturonate epimerase
MSLNTNNSELAIQSGAVTDHFKKEFDDVSIYSRSVCEKQGMLFFMIRQASERFLIIQLSNGQPDNFSFTGENLQSDPYHFMKCELNHENAIELRKHFSFTNPVVLGKANSYGLGDRLGNAGPAHLESIRKTAFKPILAQQSIRELQRTNRTAEEVLDAASWAVFQTGYKEGFGADGDHLKTTGDIDLMMKAGYTMFTIDPSDYVVNEAITMSDDELQKNYRELPWELLQDQPEKLLERLTKEAITLNNGFKIKPTHRELMAGMVKYGRVITHTKSLADYVEEAYPDHPSELELSVDETSKPTTLFEHYLIASELKRLGVELVSLAPRFCGDFEKGIDFKGDLKQFRKEYIQHLAIAEKFGGYKLSIHSGSDKFSVYEVIGSLNNGTVHVKTAGTSYLEALRTIAEADPEFFREILRFSLKRFDTDKKTYHISADPARIADPDSLDKQGLLSLLDDNDARQVLHVTYGSVLSGEQAEAKEFKDKFMEVLENNEELHERNLVIHFDKHLAPFNPA